MKTTLDLPDEVYARAETYAAQHGITLSKLVAESLEKTVRPEPVSESEHTDRMAKLFKVLKASNAEPMKPMKREEIYDRQVFR